MRDQDQCVTEACQKLEKDYQAKKAYSGEAGIGAQCVASEAAYPFPRRIIDRLIDYHNRQSVQLHALLRALPQDMSREAEQALYDLAKAALGDIR